MRKTGVPIPILCIQCDASNTRFVLSEEHEAWAKEFGSLELAVDYASTLFSMVVPLKVLNEEGRVFLHSTVLPKAPAID